MVMLRIGASLVSDSPTAATASGHKRTCTLDNVHSFIHTNKH